MVMLRHRWTWTGFTGAPGVSTFYALGTNAQVFVDGIKTFLQIGIANGALGSLPTGVKIVPDTFVDKIDETDGSLDSAVGITSPGDVVGATSGGFGSPMGLCVTWGTGALVTGPAGRPRRLRGRTFLVPLSGSDFDTNGTFSDTKITGIRTAANTYLAGAWNPCVWSRPFPNAAAANGQAAAILNASIKDKAAILTSRRD
jgi:hypothetical protein